jgi:ribonuclease VapC
MRSLATTSSDCHNEAEVVIDTSALLAVLLGEAEATRFVNAILADPTRRVGAATLVEAAAVMMSRKGPQGPIALDALLQRLSIDVISMTADAAAFARSAYARWGRGVGTPGVLNFGDCLAYGVAMAEGEQLLFKGEDFPHTDVARALY